MSERHDGRSPIGGAEHEATESDSREPGQDRPSERPASRARVGRTLALGLTVVRCLLGPLVVIVAWLGGDGRLLAGAVIVATLSDIFDGKVARRYGVATARLRRFDSVADTVFYIGAGIALWLRHPEVLRSEAPLIAAFVLMQVAGHLVDVWKFGRDTSYHTWSGRAFGVALCIATTLVFWSGRSAGWLAAALIIGMIAHVDAFVITMILPSWHHDVNTVRNALRIRRSLGSSAVSEPVATRKG